MLPNALFRPKALPVYLLRGIGALLIGYPAVLIYFWWGIMRRMVGLRRRIDFRLSTITFGRFVYLWTSEANSTQAYMYILTTSSTFSAGST